MIISIASGKGGTGKTTVATNLAMTIEKGVQLLDCDVEEPNAHLFIRPEFEPKECVTVSVPEIDEKKCTFCGECGELCQFKAIAVMPIPNFGIGIAINDRLARAAAPKG